MCLDLSSPEDIPGIENTLTVDLFFQPPTGGGGLVRVIPNQGGLNGCTQKRAVEQQKMAANA